MRFKNSQLMYSPTDLIVFLESPFASWMDRRYLENPDSLAPDEDDPMLKILQARGHAHEGKYFATIQGSGQNICEIPRADGLERTREALKLGPDVIYQAHLEYGEFAGYADFLRRVHGPFAEPRYAVWDTKLARHPKPYYLIQLCCYAEMLEGMTGVCPEVIGVILGDESEHEYRSKDFWFYYQHIKRRFLELMAHYPQGEGPIPEASAAHGRWSSSAERWLLAQDHLSQVAGIGRGQIRKLEDSGVATLQALARKHPGQVKGISEAVLTRLHQQASLQVRSQGLERPLYEVLAPPVDSPGLGLAALPPASAADVFFDMEGFPAANDWLEYLFGAVHLVAGQPVFADWWAHDAQQERVAFEAFIDWIFARWCNDPRMHIYHYAGYETSAVKRLMGQYATREHEVDTLLRNHVFVDLYAIVRRGIRVGEPGYSLKNLEHLYLARRSGEVQDALASVVAYDAWCESAEPQRWQESPALKSIRDYNEDDCLSTWKLAVWLRERQAAAKIEFVSPLSEPAEDKAPITESDDARVRREFAESILQSLPVDPPADEDARERLRVRQLLAWLIEFHRRADKPMWWQLFERLSMTTEELRVDMECIGGLMGKGVPEPFKRSQLFHFDFDPEQDTKIAAGDQVKLIPDMGFTAQVEDFDSAGTLTLKIGNSKLGEVDAKEVLQTNGIAPYQHFDTTVIRDSILEIVRTFEADNQLPGALRAFLYRLTPIVGGEPGQILQGVSEKTLDAGKRLVSGLDDSCLCLQGPPGSGKTYAAARMIVDLIEQGAGVGITSNSHKAILNLMAEVCHAGGAKIPVTKVGGDKDDPILQANPGIRYEASSSHAERAWPGELVGGTAWLFARSGLAGKLDYLFVDEAGQMSLANLVGVARSARNIVLMGDQMQLGQPTQGSHPGESGASVLGYYLQDHSTIPPERGLFLETSWRMHPAVCSFISQAVYEGRLVSEPHTANRLIKLPADGGKRVRTESGLLFIPVEHEGNVQGSDEEVKVIQELVEELIGRERTGKDGAVEGTVNIATDILIVAPYNLQVRNLIRALPTGARVASVDKFQGQEAPIVIVSMCASQGEFGNRGMKFVLDKNRLNVAISRAQSLAIVVGDPRLAQAPCNSIDDMRRLNLYCWIQEGRCIPSS